MALGWVLVLALPVLPFAPVPQLPHSYPARRPRPDPGRGSLMPVSLTLDLRAASPAYEQVRAQLGGHIRSGTLTPGTKLPVVRALASDLGVAVNTIARAYQELEREGLVTTRRRVGTIVCDVVPVVPPGGQRAVDRLAEAARTRRPPAGHRPRPGARTAVTRLPR